MQKHDHEAQTDIQPARPSRRDRLRALLFTAGTIGTTLATLGWLAETKLPRHQGE